MKKVPTSQTISINEELLYIFSLLGIHKLTSFLSNDFIQISSVYFVL